MHRTHRTRRAGHHVAGHGSVRRLVGSELGHEPRGRASRRPAPSWARASAFPRTRSAAAPVGLTAIPPVPGRRLRRRSRRRPSIMALAVLSLLTAASLLAGFAAAAPSPPGTAAAPPATSHTPAPGTLPPAQPGAGPPSPFGFAPPEGICRGGALPGRGCGPAGRRAWPVAGSEPGRRPLVARGWERPPRPWAAGHRGVDLAVGSGRPVVAAAPGKVVFVGKVTHRGVVSIALHQSGSPPLRVTYQSVRPRVRSGAVVRAGETVATTTAAAPTPRHRCRGGCLHWGLLRGDRYLDPLSLLPPEMRGGRARLLPIYGTPHPVSHPRPERRAGRCGARPQPATPRSAKPTAASTTCSGSSAAPSSILRTAASTTPCSIIATNRGCSWPSSPRASTIMAMSPP